MNTDECRQAIMMKIATKYRSLRGCRLAVASSLALVLGGVFSCDGYAAQVEASEQSTTTGCATAEECFVAAAWPKERLGQTLTKDQVVALKLERLRKVMEGFPGTQWAKRAGLLSGVILIDRIPLPVCHIFGQPSEIFSCSTITFDSGWRGLAASRRVQGGGQYV